MHHVRKHDDDMVGVDSLTPPITCGEMLGAVQTLIAMRKSDSQTAVLQVSGPSGGEGASTVASRLAHFVNAEMNVGVLLITYDSKGDPTKTTEHRSFSQGDLVVSAGSDIDIGVVAGSLSDKSRRQAMAGRLRDELDGLPPEIGFVIVDPGPILTSLAACSFGGQVDGVLLVTEAERSTAPECDHARAAIELAGGRIIGVILNKRRRRIPTVLARMFGLAASGRPAWSAGPQAWTPASATSHQSKSTDGAR